MLILITYDVATTELEGSRRLRRIAQACKDYGVRVQKSVFECRVGDKEWTKLRARLLDEMKLDQDSLRFYFLDEENVRKTEHHGIAEPANLNEPLVL